MFPAIFDWCQFSDFDTQIKDRMRLRMGEVPLDTEEANKTADSTFKPKSLRNKAKVSVDTSPRQSTLFHFFPRSGEAEAGQPRAAGKKAPEHFRS